MSAAGFDAAGFVADLQAAGCTVVLSRPGTVFGPSDEAPTWFVRPAPGYTIVMAKWAAAMDAGRNNFEEMAAADISAWRSKLAAALRSQEGSGGVKRRTLVAAGIDVELCTKVNQAEWRMKDRAAVPCMCGAPPESIAARSATWARR